MRKSRTTHHLVGRPNGAAKLAPAMERAGINASTIRSAEAPGAPSSAAAARHHQPCDQPGDQHGDQIGEKKREAVDLADLPPISREEAVRRATEKIINATPRIVDAVMQQAGNGNYLHAKFLFDFVGLAASPMSPPATADQSLAAVLLRSLDLDQASRTADPAVSGNGTAVTQAAAPEPASPGNSAPSAPHSAPVIS